MNPGEKLERFFKYWKVLVDKGEVSPLGPVEITILHIYKDWEIENADIQELFGSSKGD